VRREIRLEENKKIVGERRIKGHMACSGNRWNLSLG